MARQMKYGVMFFTNQPMPQLVRQAQLAEELGFDSIWLLDSQLVGRDVYVAMTACALNTKRIQIGPGVTHTVTRHPSVTAGGFASLVELAPERVNLAVGFGDSAIRGIGGKPARLEEFRADFSMICRLLRGETVQYRNLPVKIAWIDVEKSRRIPVFPVPGGPRAHVLSGELVARGFGHGVVVYCTVPELEERLQRVNEGASKAGKTLADLPILWFVQTSISKDQKDVKEHMASRFASGMRHKYYDYKRGDITAEQLGVSVELARRFAEEYEFTSHATPGSQHARLIDLVPEEVWLGPLGIGGRAAGTPEQALQVLRRGLQHKEIGHVVLVLPPPGPAVRLTNEQIMETFAKEVRPYVGME